MLPSLHIDHSVPALKLIDSIQVGLDLMDEYKIYQLPVVEGKKYLGYVSEDGLLNATVDSIDELVIAGEKQFVSDMDSLYASLKKMIAFNLSSLAVLSTENHYLGVITTHSIIRAFEGVSSIRSEGGVFSIIVSQNDYSLSELSRIIESNGYKVLSVELLTIEDDPLKIEVVFKLNSQDLSTALSALERHGYQINLKFGSYNQDRDNRDRLDHLIKLMNL